jgi:hypothetical protein
LSHFFNFALASVFFLPKHQYVHRASILIFPWDRILDPILRSCATAPAL